MFIYIPCLALLACLHSAVGAPIRFAKIYGLSEMPSSVDGRDAKSFWTQKQGLQNRGDHGGLWVTAFDPYTSAVIGREQDCRSATVFKNADPWSAVVIGREQDCRSATVFKNADPWSAVVIGREQDCRSATVIEKTDLWSPIVHWARRPDDSAAADVHWATDETVSMTTYYGKAAGEHTNDDGDTDNSTHKLLVFLIIILIVIFLYVQPRFNFLLVIQGN